MRSPLPPGGGGPCPSWGFAASGGSGVGVAPIRFGAPGFPFLRLAGLPRHSVHHGVLRPLSRGRRRPAGHAFPYGSRAPSGHFTENQPPARARDASDRRRRPAAQRGAGNPPELPCPSALAEPGIRSPRGSLPPPRSGLDVSHVLAGLLPPGPLGHVSARNAPGLRPSGFSSSRRVGDPLEPPLLSCRSPRPDDLATAGTRLGSRV